jgi:hypothetical protein
MSTDNPVTLAVIGCASGQRGDVRCALYFKCKVVAIAEPRSQTRALFADQYGVDDSLVCCP